MNKFAIILSGCGVYDGSEIHEAVLTMLSIVKHNADYQLFAPNYAQKDVIDHLSGEALHEERNILVEASRIGRGDIKPLSDYNPDNYVGIILPGGFGAAKNLSDYASKGAKCVVNEEVEKAIIATNKAGKLIGAECIAPVLLASIFPGAMVTIGNDKNTEADIQAMGAAHKTAAYNEVVYDPNYKLYTTPCYMLAQNIYQVYEGADALIKAMLNAL